eukprot:TRINITY_DN24779_c0_g1_i1.p1 TRINITY_DN24779_c0_g1~~TRINITY_DN24779_c0_g1_i1.p1  ORF type:complete len:587 (+),score=189.74 TRINITY_DN24779_c0_g1_i1:81-1841(+)
MLRGPPDVVRHAARVALPPSPTPSPRGPSPQPSSRRSASGSPHPRPGTLSSSGSPLPTGRKVTLHAAHPGSTALPPAARFSAAGSFASSAAQLVKIHRGARHSSYAARASSAGPWQRAPWNPGSPSPSVASAPWTQLGTPTPARALSAGPSSTRPSARGRRQGALLSGRVRASPLSRFGQWAGVRERRDGDEDEYLQRLLDDDSDGARKPKNIFISPDYDFWDFEREMRRREELQRQETASVEAECPQLGRGTSGLVRVIGAEAARDALCAFGRLRAADWKSAKHTHFARLDQQRKEERERASARDKMTIADHQRQAKQTILERRQQDRLHRQQLEQARERMADKLAKAVSLTLAQAKDKERKLQEAIQEEQKQRALAAQRLRGEMEQARTRRLRQREEDLRDQVYERHLRAQSDRYQIERERRMQAAQAAALLQQERDARREQRRRMLNRIAEESRERHCAVRTARGLRAAAEQRRHDERQAFREELHREVETYRKGRDQRRERDRERSKEEVEKRATQFRMERRRVVKDSDDRARQRSAEARERVLNARSRETSPAGSTVSPPRAPRVRRRLADSGDLSGTVSA